MSLENISKAADRERAKNNRPPKPDFKKEKVYQQVSPESWSIYRKIYPYSVSFGFTILSFIGLTITLTLYFLSENEWSWYGMFFFAGIIALRTMIHFCMKIIRFQKFKRWRSELGFPVNGWDFLGSSSEFPKRLVWDRTITVKINFKDTAQNEERKLMHDALFLLTTNANKQFYAIDGSQSGYSGDIRDKWQITDKLYACGSGDPSVVGQIYLSLNKHFKPIHEKYQCIDSAEITFSKKFFTADPPSSSGD